MDETPIMGRRNVSFAINKYMLPHAEFSYFPGVGRNKIGIRIPIHESSIVPFAVFGLGGSKSIQCNGQPAAYAFVLSILPLLHRPSAPLEPCQLCQILQHNLPEMFRSFPDQEPGWVTRP